MTLNNVQLAGAHMKKVLLYACLILFVYFAIAIFPVTAAAQVVERVSVDKDGLDPNGVSVNPSISDDGQFVTFDSFAADLVSVDGNGFNDVFVRDRQSGTTTLVSVKSDGTQGNAFSGFPVISADGRYVAFQSNASNLVSVDGNGFMDVFVHDRQTGETTLVSVATDGTQGDAFSGSASISGDGRYVAFSSIATNLLGAGNDTNGLSDIFVRDRQTGTTTRVSVDSDGNEGSGGIGNTMQPHISNDGRYVAFASDMTNLVTGDANVKTDVFVHDRDTGTTTLVSVHTDETQTDANAEDLAISGDGRYVAFRTASDKLVDGDGNADTDIFIRDTQSNITTRVSVDSDGNEANGGSFAPSLNSDGRFVSFSSAATNLLGVGNDNNTQNDVFVHDRQTGKTTRVSEKSDGTEGDQPSDFSLISANGQYVAFASGAENNTLVDNDNNGFIDVFVASNPLRPPFIGTVNDGTGDDIDTQTSLTTINANWSGFTAAASAIASYEWAIGTSAGGTDIQDFIDVGSETAASNTSLSLTDGATYFASVRANDENGNVSDVASSDGVSIDTTPPVAGGCSLIRH